MEDYYKAELLNLKAHPELNEKWVQKLIADDPSTIGLGELELRAQERIQPRAGRLDLLLQDPETRRRYEVELQLGSTDETHVIRTIEYWDIERKRYPHYEHCAVLIAEDITSRFLNVLALFNGTIPFIAIQMRAVRVAGKLSLVFTKVMDELVRGPIDEDEDAISAPADRNYWEQKVGKPSLLLLDDMLALVETVSPSLGPKYNKYYVGMQKDGISSNFITFRPKRAHINIGLNLPKTDDVDAKIEAAGLDALEYSTRSASYKIRLKPQDIKTKGEALKNLISLAFERRMGSQL